jgi:glycosyltransferase involved in cell wall biosynthesis
VVYNPVRISRKLNGTEVDSPPDYLLFAGQVTRRKGVLAVATAAKAFMHEFPNLHLVFAGPVGHDGAVPTDDRIRSILDWRLAQRVHFLGRIPWDILQLWMANARALLFPSTLEFCPMVVAEAMANRCPVLVADGPPFTEYLTHERDALLIPANDPQALAAAARRLLLDSALRAWLVDNAYETSRRVFGLQNCLMKSLAFYELAREQWGQRRSN